MQRASVQETKESPSPTEIARETLRRLSVHRVAPTPDNYRQLYHEIAGHSPETVELAEQQAPPQAAPAPWGKLVKDLLRHWETRHGKITIAKKREGLERVLKKFSSDPALLGVKLQALIESWTEPSSAEDNRFEPPQ